MRFRRNVLPLTVLCLAAILLSGVGNRGVRAQLPAPAAIGDDTRIRITQSMLPLVITQPNSYYFGSTLSWTGSGPAISIQLNPQTNLDTRCTIDLNGFELRGSRPAPALRHGIYIPSGEGNGIRIHNGHIFGFDQGVGSLGYGLRVDDVGFSYCSTGIDSSGAAVITRCTFTRCVYGTNLRAAAVAATLEGGTVLSQSASKLCGTGFKIDGHAQVTACSAFNNTQIAFELGSGVSIVDCNLASPICIRLNGTANLVRGCKLQPTTLGIDLLGSANRIVDNHVVGPGPSGSASCTGIYFGASAARNVVTGNSVSGCWVGASPRNYLFAQTASNYLPNALEILLVELPQRIEVPCTVKLAGSLRGVSGQSGITIAADNITIDLAGHSLTGESGSGDGILVPSAQRGLVVKNGTIAGWGASGISATNSEISTFEDLLVHGNGQHGLLVGPRSSVRAVNASRNGQTGITAAVQVALNNVVASNNGQQGILMGDRAQVIDCQATNNSGAGIGCFNAAQVRRCHSVGNQREGIWMNDNCHVEDCSASDNVLDGIRVASRCRIMNNQTSSNGTAAGNQGGITVSGTRNRIEGNNCSGEDLGLSVTGINNVVVRNSFNGGGWYIEVGNVFGPLLTVTSGADLAAFTNGAHPMANYRS